MQSFSVAAVSDKERPPPGPRLALNASPGAITRHRAEVTATEVPGRDTAGPPGLLLLARKHFDEAGERLRRHARRLERQHRQWQERRSQKQARREDGEATRPEAAAGAAQRKDASASHNASQGSGLSHYGRDNTVDAGASRSLHCAVHGRDDAEEESQFSRSRRGGKGIEQVAVREGPATPGYKDSDGKEIERQPNSDHWMAGAAAGGVVEITLYPLDTVKTRIMAASSQSRVQFGELFKGLYHGASTSTLGAVASTATFFGTYEPVKMALLEKFPENYSSLAQMCAASVASLAATAVRMPWEVVKQQLQTTRIKQPVLAASMVLRSSGIRGLYIGTVPVLLRDLPFNALEFVAYEQLKRAYLGLSRRNELSGQEAATLGGLAGAFTGAVTTPLDTIKTRQMTMVGPGSQAMKKNLFFVGREMVREEGIKSLFRGMGARLLWITVGGCIFFSTLEVTESMLVQQRRERQMRRQYEDAQTQLIALQNVPVAEA